MSHEYRMEQLRAAIAAARKNFKKDANFFVVGLTYGCRGQWERVRRLAQAVPEWDQAMGELDTWADACFEEQGAFSVLGV